MKTDSKSLERIQRELKIRWGIVCHEQEDRFATTDIVFEWNGKPQQLEVKCRRCNHGQYPDTVIELSKYKELEKVRGSLATMVEDGFVLYNWKELKEAFVGTSQKWARGTTDSDVGSRDWKLKTFVHFRVDGNRLMEYSREGE